MPKNALVVHKPKSTAVVVPWLSAQPNYVPIRKSLTKKQAKKGPIAWLDREALGGKLLMEHVCEQQSKERHVRDSKPLGKAARCYQCKGAYGSTPRTIEMWQANGSAKKRFVCQNCYIVWMSTRRTGVRLDG